MRKIGLHPQYPAIRDAVIRSVSGGSTAIGIYCRQGKHRSVAVAENVSVDIMAAGFPAACMHLEMSTWPTECLDGTCGDKCCNHLASLP